MELAHEQFAHCFGKTFVLAEWPKASRQFFTNPELDTATICSRTSGVGVPTCFSIFPRNTSRVNRIDAVDDVLRNFLNQHRKLARQCNSAPVLEGVSSLRRSLFHDFGHQHVNNLLHCACLHVVLHQVLYGATSPSVATSSLLMHVGHSWCFLDAHTVSSDLHSIHLAISRRTRSFTFEHENADKPAN